MGNTLFAVVCNLCGWPLLPLPGPARGRCLHCLSTPIHRAVGSMVAVTGLPRDAGVYELSSRGALVRYLRHRFDRLYVSEFFDDLPPGESRHGVPCQDVQELRLPDGSFDLVTSTEVFEHVPDDRRGFREVHRVLRPGGRFIFTVPLRDGGETLERATLAADGTIIHLIPPEFHSDRIRGGRKVLAFRTYGRDICARLAEAGFQSAIRTVEEPRHGISGQSVIVAMRATIGRFSLRRTGRAVMLLRVNAG